MRVPDIVATLLPELGDVQTGYISPSAYIPVSSAISSLIYRLQTTTLHLRISEQRLSSKTRHLRKSRDPRFDVIV